MLLPCSVLQVPFLENAIRNWILMIYEASKS
jgi:hypothetical protein